MAGTSYTRQSTLTDGDTITASLFNAEYNQLVTAFSYAASGTTGHQHDGGAGEGGNIEIIGDQDFNNKIVVDSSNNRWSVYVEVGGSAVEQVRIEDGVVYPVTDSDVDLGTNALRFKDAYIDSLTATGNLTIGGNIDVDGTIEFDGLSGTGSVTVTDILDQDDMSGNSATALATQQSIKAYVDAQQDTVDTFGEVLALSNTTAGTDISVSTDDKVQFRDSAIYINSSADGQLDIVADTEIQIAATTVDINGAINASGEIIAASLDISGNIDVDGVTNLDVVDIDGAVDIATTLAVAGNVDFNGDLDVDGVTNLDVVDIDGAVNMATTLLVTGNVDFNGDLDVDGTTNLDVVDIDGAVDIATTLTVGGNVDFNGDLDVDGTIEFDAISGTGSVTVTDILDQDDMSGNSATALATQQSIKAYVDTQITAEDLDITTDSGTIAIDLDSETLTVSGGTGLDSSATGNAVTLAIDSTVATLTGSQTLTNKSLTAPTLTGTATVASLDISGDIDVDGTTNLDGFTSVGNGTITGDLVIQETGFPRITLQDLDGTNTRSFIDHTGSDLIFTAQNNTAHGRIIFNRYNNSSTVTSGYFDAAGKLFINGDLDVDGTTNLDVVDIDGAVDMASTLAVGGVVTANAGVVVDNITIDGNEIDVGSGNLTLDVAGDISLDADSSGQVRFKDGGAEYLSIMQSNSDVVINSSVADKDIIFKGKDGALNITALTLDMSDEGAAIFNGHGTFNDTVAINSTSSGALLIAGSGGGINFTGGNNRVLFNSNRALEGTTDGATLTVGEGFTTINIDGAATFTGAVTANAGVVVDNFTLDGTTLALSSGSMTLDSAAQIILDGADDGAIQLRDDGTKYADIYSTSGDFYIKSTQSDKDIKFQGNDGGVGFTALNLDMSDAGTATFNHHIKLSATNRLFFDGGSNTYIQESASDDLRFFVGGSQAVRVRASGTDILGTVTADAITVDNITINGNEIDVGSGDLTLDVAGNTVINSDAGGVYFLDGAVTYATMLSTGAVFNEGGVDADFRVESNNNANMLFVDGGNDAVGIGTGSIDYTTSGRTVVHIEGSAGALLALEDTGAKSYLFQSGNDLLIENDTASGKLVFGTNSSTSRFEIAADGSLSTPTAGNSNVRFGSGAGISLASGGTRNTVVGDEAGTAITTGDNNVALGFRALYTEDTGNRSVAIGDFSLQNQNNADSNYNVGVGYAAGLAVTTGVQNTLIGGLAGDALTLGGNNVSLGYQALTADTQGSSSVALGAFALSTQNSTSEVNMYNTAVGKSAGAAVTTGVQNTLIGGLAGDAITTGVNNVALGVGAAGSTTTGEANIAIGTSALASNTTGGTNVAVGQDNLYYNTTASNNTAIGHNAMVANTTASNNTAVGKSALAANTTGAANVAVGSGAGYQNITGAGNIAIGLNALYSNTASSLNVAIGTGALDALNIGSGNGYNVAIGDQAGGSVTTGIDNTLIGGLAGDALTNADYNVAIGRSALTSDTLGSRSVAVGYQALAFQNFTSATETYNTAVGHLAGNQVTTGTKNTLIGGLAGDAITTASFNTAVGHSAGGSLTTGLYNTFIGCGTIAGTGNFGSGALVTTGSKNTILGGYNGNQNGLDIRTSNNNIVLSDGDGNPRVRVDSSGRVLVGTTNIANLASATPNVVTDESFGINNGTNIAAIGVDRINFNVANYYVLNAAATGVKLVNGATSWTTQSDENSKENIVELSSALTAVNAMRCVRYNLKSQTPDDVKIGFIAQDWQSSYPEVVATDTDGTLGMNYTETIPVLLKAIQEQQALIESLTARIETLEG